MWQRNNGQAEDDLQFRFTAYLVSAVKRRRKDYLIQLYKRSSIESSSEAEALPAFQWHGSKQKSISQFRCSLFLDEVQQVM